MYSKKKKLRNKYICKFNVSLVTMMSLNTGAHNYITINDMSIINEYINTL